MHADWLCFCIPLKTITAEEVIQACIDDVYSKFGDSLKMLSDNGTEFKNKIFEQVAKELGLEYKLYTPPYQSASNGRMEGFHAFLKACIALTCAACNFMLNEHSKESPFFLMFDRDPVLRHNTLVGPTFRYLGTNLNTLFLEALKNMFEIAATNLRIAREKGGPENKHLPTKLQPGDTVLIQNHTKGPFNPKYIGDYRVVAIKVKVNLTSYTANIISLRATPKVVYTLTFHPGTHHKPTQPWCEYYLV